MTTQGMTFNINNKFVNVLVSVTEKNGKLEISARYEDEHIGTLLTNLR